MDAIEKRILQLIDENRDKIIAFARDIYSHAELGYKEFRTAEKFTEILKGLNLKVVEGLAITGVKGYLKGDAQPLSVALIGELDALRIPTHPYANPETGAAHSCGHHAQLAGVVGAALALTDPAVKAALDGEVVFFGVPAEEYGEIEFKNSLKERGEIVYGGGKCELIRIGAFDDISISIVHHTGKEGVSVGSGTSNGFVSKVVRIKGREAHAAGAPEKGINALSAASLGLSALGYLRETFRDQDSVRVHPIITKGGNLVNVIPGEVVIETLVRGRTIEAIVDADKKTDRAFKAGAFALGAGYKIETMPGYLPKPPDPPNPALLAGARLAAPDQQIREIEPTFHTSGSSDVADIRHIMPTLSFNTGGAVGAAHSDRFDIVDEELAYIVTAKIFALGAYGLLKDNGAQAKAAMEQFKPIYTKEEYIAFMDSLNRKESKEPDL